MARQSHARRTRKRKAKPARGSEQQLALLAQLMDVAAKTGISVREERLHREVGYSVRGGRCMIEGAEVLLLDSAATAADCIEVLLDFLGDCDLGDIYIEPQLRQLIGGEAATEHDVDVAAEVETASVSPSA